MYYFTGIIFCLTRISMLVTEVESTSHNNPSLPHEAASTIRKEGSLSNSLHSQAKDHALEESSSGLHSSRNGNMPTATASTLGCSVQVVISPPPGVIRVYPRALNMTLPEGSVVAISDENWIAVTGHADPS
ncbi:hypothetical protein SAY87_017645 [Trapa incisa]|uniref:Uncharacterized protein n=1 Tax=Trapa incisa TaxID=236973 RepID=A0AAN7L6W5_9MYRT|nr:hypothetical protein SAY87_017645 [Trapa incisa]